MSKIYAPLRFAGKITIESIANTLSCGQFSGRECLSEMSKLSSDEAIQISLRSDFMLRGYSGPHKTISEGLRKDLLNPFASNAFGENPIVFVRDYLIVAAVADTWSKCKQAYLPDADFYDALSDTESFAVCPDLLKRLPYNAFYIDFKNLKSDFDGCFVYVNVLEDNSVVVCITRLSGELFFNDAHCITPYDFPSLDSEGIAELSRDDFDETIKGVKKINRRAAEFIGCSASDTFDNSEYSKLLVFVFQFMTYLVSRNPDIEESELTKRTYRPSATIKNKFSEVRQWDVGFRYGEAFRLSKSKSERASDIESHGDESPHHSRMSPRPHSRCAHWHKYWVGEGRRRLEIKWIAPTIVGGKLGTTTIHKAVL